MRPKPQIKILVLSILLLTTLSSYYSHQVRAAEVNQQATPTTGVTEVSPVVTSTPRPDGTVIHVVEYGQTLYDIALAYGVSIQYIEGLNYLSNSNIYVGQKLVIQPANTLTPVGSATVTLTNTPAPTSTKKPTPKPTRTPTPTLSPELQVTPIPTVTPAPVASGFSLGGIDPILLGIFGIGLTGVVLMVVGLVIRERG